MGSIPGIAWRKQIEAAIAGGKPDVIPAIFRLDKWYEARVRAGDLPTELRGMHLEQVEDHLGLARSARAGKVFHDSFGSGVECAREQDGDTVATVWTTPRGALRRVQRWGVGSADPTYGDRNAVLAPVTVEYPIKSWEDYGRYAEVMRSTEYVPAYDEFRRYDSGIGDAGLPMVILGANPFHDLLLSWTGYERGYLDLYDRPDVVMEAVGAADACCRRMWDIVADSPARLVMHGVNFDARMTPPNVFREHFLPYLKEFTAVMHSAGKLVAFHADGDLTGLLELVLEAGFDVADCFACSPLVPSTTAQARAAWRDRICIWGGLPSTLLEAPTSLQELEAHLGQLWRDVAPGDHFMFGISDQAMPGSNWEHILFACRWWKGKV